MKILGQYVLVCCKGSPYAPFNDCLTLLIVLPNKRVWRDPFFFSFIPITWESPAYHLHRFVSRFYLSTEETPDISYDICLFLLPNSVSMNHRPIISRSIYLALKHTAFSFHSSIFLFCLYYNNNISTILIPD